MSFGESIGVAGRIHLSVYEPGGRLVEERRVNNLVTLEGRRLLGRCLAGLVIPGTQLQLAIGTGTRATSLDDLTLEREVAAVPVDSPQVVVDGDGATRRAMLRVRAVFPALVGETQLIGEAGVVLQVGGQPLLFNRAIFPVVSRAERLEVALAWEILF